jgi:hypothetical protein
LVVDGRLRPEDPEQGLDDDMAVPAVRVPKTPSIARDLQVLENS